ncbi:MAG: acetolactate synthase large subunit, partial [Alphaproteobacteria bacterium]|nr:acetolactate synthase large subunit [Alphaproteobacteria bacterium]
MNGAELLIATAKSEGIEICFANPGTTEMPFVAAFDSEPGIRPILGLHETVCTSAADGYARMKGRAAMVLLHLGPGLANGTANLHNARRAHVPMFVVVGDHTTWHRPFDPLLNMEVEALARTSSGHVKQNRSADSLGSDTAEAIAETRAGGGQISTLVVPHDSQWTETDAAIPEPGKRTEQLVSSAQVSQAAQALAEMPGNTALMLGGAGLSEAGLKAAGRIARKTGCRLITDNFFTRMERGAGLPPVDRLAYFPEQAAAQLGEFDCVVLAGLRPPVAFFGYQDGISQILTGEQAVSLCGVGDDVVGTLTALSEDLGAPDSWDETPLAPPEIPEGDLAPEKLSAVIAALQPEGAILVDEGLTSAVAYF